MACVREADEITAKLLKLGLTLRLAFAQPHSCKRGIGKHAVGNQPVARRAVRPGQIVPNDPEVVEGYVRELWAAGTFSDRPDLRCSGLQAFVDFDVAATVQFNTGNVEPDPGGVGTAPCRDQDVATLDGLLA